MNKYMYILNFETDIMLHIVLNSCFFFFFNIIVATLMDAF